MIFINFSLIYIFIAVALASELRSSQIYRVQNRQDIRLYLTAISVKQSNTNRPIIADAWRGSATQKWRLISIDNQSSMFELKPTSDETVVMSVDSQNPDLVSQDETRWYNRIGISNSPHQWNIISVDGGYSQLKSYKTGKCLQNSGSGKQVGVANCVNSLRQQWLLESI